MNGAMQGRRVLVVDDDDMVRSVVVSLLRRGGVETLDAGSGAAAVELFNERHADIDCVLVDYSMPGMRGDEVLRQLRRISPDVRVILASGFADGGELEGMDEQPNYVLNKPFDMSSLLDAVALVVG